MKGVVASILILVALVAGAGIGYFANSSSQKTATTTYTYTATIPATTTYTSVTTILLTSGMEVCTVVEYHVWSVETFNSSTTIGGTSTQSYPVTTFQTVGYPTSTTITSYPTGTITGQIAYWNATSCS